MECETERTWSFSKGERRWFLETIDWRNSCYSHAKLTANVLKMICNCLKGAVLTTESWHTLTMNKLNEIILCFSPKNLSFVDLEEAVNEVPLLFGFRQNSQQSRSYICVNKLEKCRLHGFVKFINHWASKRRGHFNGVVSTRQSSPMCCLKDLSLALSCLTFSLLD